MNKKKNIKPPGAAEWMMKKFFHDSGSYTTIADLEEVFLGMAEKNIFTAKFWYWKQLISALPAYFFNKIYWVFIMFKNYLKTGFRYIKRQKLNSAVNIFGLSLGLACCILIFLFAADEYSYDRFYEKSDRIFAVVQHIHHFNDTRIGSPAPMGQALKENYPEVTDCVRLYDYFSGLVKYKNNIFNEDILLSDPNFFGIFSFTLEKGNPETAIESENSVVISRNMAVKYFGNEDPMGKELTITIRTREKNFIVSGITENCPKSSTIQFDFLINLKNYESVAGRGLLSRWDMNLSYKAFLLLEDGASSGAVEQKFPDFINNYFKPNAERIFNNQRNRDFSSPEGEIVSYRLLNIQDLHFSPGISRFGNESDKSSLFILGGIAVFILLIALINYMNLFTGTSSVRATEIGVRKILGADKNKIALQFLSESFIITVFSFIISIVILLGLLPVFNQLVNKQLGIDYILNLKSILFIVFFILTVSFISGSFSAFIVAKFQPVEIIKGKFRIGGKNLFTKGLVILQFSFSIILLISTLIMGKQIRYIKNRDPGFQKEGLVAIKTYEDNSSKGALLIDLFKNNVIDHNSVLNVTGVLSTFNKNIMYSAPHNVNGNRVFLNINRVHYGFLNTMGINLVEGRDFSAEHITDTTAIIVNRKFISAMNIEEPVGKNIQINITGNPTFRIIGIVDDYGVNKLDTDIMPVMLYISPRIPLYYIIVKIAGDNIPGTIEFLKRMYKQIQPDKPFTFSFIDDEIEASYYSYVKWNKIIDYSLILALIITCIGMYCLTSMIFSGRVKEIGIRKVLGASVFEIFYSLIKEFMFLVFIANIISWPAAYFLMSRWMDNFAYKAGFGFPIFLLSGILSFIFVFLTIIYQGIKACGKNPVDSLRYE